MPRKIILVSIIVILILSSCTIAPPDAPVRPTATPISQSDEGEEKQDNNLTPLPTEDKSNTLVFFVGEYCLLESIFKHYDFRPESIKMLINKYDCEFIEYEQYEKYSQDLRTKMLSGDNSFDIFIIYPFYMEIMPIIDEGYYVDLNDNPNMMIHYDQMFDEERTACMQDEKFFGFPYSLFAFYNTYDLDKLDALGFLENDITTFEGLFKLDDKFKEEALDDTPSVIIEEMQVNYILINHLLYSNFNRETYNIDFSNIDFKTPKSILRELKSREIVVAFDPNHYDKSLVGYYDSNYNNNKPYNYVTQAVYIDESSKARGASFLMTYLCINPYSEKIDLAMEFIDDYAKVMKTKGSKELTSDYIYSDINTYINNELNFPPPNFIEQYKIDFIGNVLKDSKPFWKFPGFDECAEILMQYYDNEIEHDAAIDNMERIMDTVSREYTLD